jgi:hypothetical protein
MAKRGEDEKEIPIFVVVNTDDYAPENSMSYGCCIIARLGCSGTERYLEHFSHRGKGTDE